MSDKNTVNSELVKNYDDMYAHSANNLDFLGQYGNEKFTSTKVRKAIIDFMPQRHGLQETTADLVYSIGALAKGAIITSVFTSFKVGETPVTGDVVVKAGALTLATVPTAADDIQNPAIAIGDVEMTDFTEITFESSEVYSPEAGRLVVIVEYIDPYVQEGAYGS